MTTLQMCFTYVRVTTSHIKLEQSKKCVSTYVSHMTTYDSPYIPHAAVTVC